MRTPYYRPQYYWTLVNETAWGDPKTGISWSPSGQASIAVSQSACRLPRHYSVYTRIAGVNLAIQRRALRMSHLQKSEKTKGKISYVQQACTRARGRRPWEGQTNEKWVLPPGIWFASMTKKKKTANIYESRNVSFGLDTVFWKNRSEPGWPNAFKSTPYKQERKPPRLTSPPIIRRNTRLLWPATDFSALR